MTDVSAVQSGRCRYCHCPGDFCKLAANDKCAWFDQARTVCSNAACLTAFFAARRRAEAAQQQAQRKRTPGEVQAVIVAEKKKSRQVSNAKYRARVKQQQLAKDAKRGRVA